MNIVVFDTETTSLDKPFCYNIGYCIIDTETWETLKQKEFIVEQIWHNSELFSSAYYSNKRPFYISGMRAKKIRMLKFGYITQEMIRDFEKYDVEIALAYNSSFDEKVFNFNCDWFKCIHPFDTIPIVDIRGFVHNFIVDDIYKAFCEHNSFFTDAGNYSTTAETVYKYITSDTDFIESHTALDDSIIESEILRWCIESGADINGNYQTLNSIPRKIKKAWRVIRNKETIFEFTTTDIKVSKKNGTIKIV